MFDTSRLFISYRRSDSEATARSLFEALKARVGAERLFFDTADIPFGEDFRQVVHERIVASAAVLVVIGPGWAEARNERGLRLWQDDDPVRFELETALASGRRIVPLRIGGAAVPTPEQLPPELRPLAFLNMAQLRAEAFDRDVNALYRQLVGEVDEPSLPMRLRAFLVGGPVVGAVITLLLLAATWSGAFDVLGLDAYLQRLLLAAGGANRGEPVLLVRIDAASENRLQREFTPRKAALWRGDHARLVDLAARGGATAVVFDLYFEDAHPEADAALAAAVRRAAARTPPMPVVFGVRRYGAGVPDLVVPLRETGRAGSLCLAGRGGGALWTSPLAIVAPDADRREALVAAGRPALALAALAPGRLLDADVARREFRFDTRTSEPLRYSAVERKRIVTGACRTATPGAELLTMLLRIAPDGHWGQRERSVSYADLLATPVDIRLKGRVVLVGATDVGRSGTPPDVQVVRDGFVPRRVFGVELQADAIATLASGRVPQLPTADAELLTTLGAGSAGALVAFVFYRRSTWSRRVAIAAISTACVLLALAFARGGYLLDLINALVSLWTAAFAVRALQAIAERHPRFRRLPT